MLFNFITSHRERIVARTRDLVSARLASAPSRGEVAHGVPLFLDQLVARLRPNVAQNTNQIGTSASLHGGELLKSGVTIGQVVHAYGDVCQVITTLAVELGSPVSTKDFRTLNLCLDVAIAEAVTEYARQREEQLSGHSIERLGLLAHELRNLLNTATLAFEAVRSGSVGIAGSTGSLIGTSLDGMRDLVTRSLAEVRLQAEPLHHEHIRVASLLEEIEIAASLHAKSRDVKVKIEPPESTVAIDGDSQIVSSIVTNLVQNACKFTRAHGHVTIATRTTSDRVFIDVADECGGLPPGKAEELFQPYEQRGEDRTGLGLGLTISRRGAQAIGAEISVRDLPGTGCVFTVDLRRALPQT